MPFSFSVSQLIQDTQKAEINTLHWVYVNLVFNRNISKKEHN